VSVIGMDVMNMRLSLPIWLFEPTTALTRMCETFEFSELLDRAAKEKDPVLRDALVAAFVISAFAHTERVRKPFNPVLGESMFRMSSP
jgi:oxysterol-binding protein-related protein 3/6/7